jgi:DNA-binding TFAR19-related protein (PDSD5 family)
MANNQTTVPLLSGYKPPDVSIMPVDQNTNRIAVPSKPNDFSIMPIKPGVGAVGNPIGAPQITQGSSISASPTVHSNTVSAEAAKAGPSDLVEDRIGGIINTNSPLMQLAASRANQGANDRGLRNSSIAVGAAQNAVLDAAMPIASADSGAINQNTMFNASNEQQTNLQNATQAQRTSELNTAADNQSIQTNIENSMRTNLANLDVSSRAFMADLEQKNKQLIQTSANAATLFNSYAQQVAAIMTSPNLDAAGKETAIKNLQTLLQDGLAAQDAVSGLDLSSIIFGEQAAAGIGENQTGGGTEPGNGGSEPASQYTVTETSSNDPNTPPTGNPPGNGNRWRWDNQSGTWTYYFDQTYQ